MIQLSFLKSFCSRMTDSSVQNRISSYCFSPLTGNVAKDVKMKGRHSPNRARWVRLANIRFPSRCWQKVVTMLLTAKYSLLSTELRKKQQKKRCQTTTRTADSKKTDITCKQEQRGSNGERTFEWGGDIFLAANRTRLVITCYTVIYHIL